MKPGLAPSQAFAVARDRPEAALHLHQHAKRRLEIIAGNRSEDRVIGRIAWSLFAFWINT